MKTSAKIMKTSKDEMHIEISMPAIARIELVQGNELRHYEIFSLLLSLALSISVGFWTSYIATPKSLPLLWSALAFSFLTLFSVVIVLYYRSKIYNGRITKTINFNNSNDSRR